MALRHGVETWHRNIGARRPRQPPQMRLTSPGVPVSSRFTGPFKGRPAARTASRRPRRRWTRTPIKAVELLEDRSGVGYRAVASVKRDRCQFRNDTGCRARAGHPAGHASRHMCQFSSSNGAIIDFGKLPAVCATLCSVNLAGPPLFGSRVIARSLANPRFDALDGAQPSSFARLVRRVPGAESGSRRSHVAPVEVAKHRDWIFRGARRRCALP